MLSLCTCFSAFRHLQGYFGCGQLTSRLPWEQVEITLKKNFIGSHNHLSQAINCSERDRRRMGAYREIQSRSAISCVSEVIIMMHSTKRNEPCHEIMVLFALRKLIIQTRMRSHPVGLDVSFLVGPSSTSILNVCEQRMLWRDCADAQARLSLRWLPV